VLTTTGVEQREGYTALQVAAKKGRVESVQLLLQSGADINQCDVSLSSSAPPFATVASWVSSERSMHAVGWLQCAARGGAVRTRRYCAAAAALRGQQEARERGKTLVLAQTEADRGSHGVHDSTVEYRRALPHCNSPCGTATASSRTCSPTGMLLTAAFTDIIYKSVHF
jgi:hypothetical protein